MPTSFAQVNYFEQGLIFTRHYKIIIGNLFFLQKYLLTKQITYKKNNYKSVWFQMNETNHRVLDAMVPFLGKFYIYMNFFFYFEVF